MLQVVLPVVAQIASSAIECLLNFPAVEALQMQTSAAVILFVVVALPAVAAASVAMEELPPCLLNLDSLAGVAASLADAAVVAVSVADAVADTAGTVAFVAGTAGLAASVADNHVPSVVIASVAAFANTLCLQPSRGLNRFDLRANLKSFSAI